METVRGKTGRQRIHLPIPVVGLCCSVMEMQWIAGYHRIFSKREVSPCLAGKFCRGVDVQGSKLEWIPIQDS